MTTKYNSLEAIILDLAQMLQPPERLSVSAAAEKYRYVNQPGAYVGPWLNSTTPYMIEPMDETTSQDFNGLIFVGPAQSAKTDSLVINLVAYRARVDPLDTMVVCPSMVAARDFSMRRIDRLHQHSKPIGEMLLEGSDSDNTFDKHYKNGMLLSLSWPTPIELAGKPIGCVILTDRDRMKDDIDGDGEPYDLASKRTTTFGSYAMTVCESSPSRPVKDPKWIARTPHEAPPADGILSLYNRGDCRRWYWPCPHCNTYFEGKFEHLVWDRPEAATHMDMASTVRMKCPHCHEGIHPDEREMMQEWGLWVKNGQGVDAAGRVIGPVPRTRIASFWLRGVAAAFTTWRNLVVSYLDAMDDFERTGSEEALKKFYNNDLGEPYVPKRASDVRLPETLKSQSDQTLRRGMVPVGVRFLLATADVQKNKFVVAVFGVLPGAPYDLVLVDRFDISKSRRLDHEDERMLIKPASYLKDWDEIETEVIDRSYEIDDGSGRHMSIRFTACDSGGEAGVTTMAYDFYRALRNRGKHHRFILVKGDSAPSAPRTHIRYPDSSRRDAKAAARGDVPVLMFNPNIIKDALDSRMDCMLPGKGMLLLPRWLPDNIFAELCAEFRTSKGWINPSQSRNEMWDLGYYALGVNASELLRTELLDWNNPPGWAQEVETNDFVFMPKAEDEVKVTPFANTIKSGYDFSAAGRALASN